MPRPSYYPIPSSYPKPSYTQVTPSMYPQKVTATPQPYARAITATPAPETSVLGVSTTELAALPPGTVVTAMPSRTITKEPIPSGPVQEAFLARSSDGVLAVKGLGQFAKLQNLRVSVDSSDKGYAVTFSAQASAKDLELQKAFAQPQALLAISVTEMKAAILMPVVQVASVKGYLPGMKTVVELTKQEVKPTVAPTPTAKPPVVVSTCRTTKDCPKGYTCTPPKTPSCPPGKACAAVRLQWQCTLMKPSPTIQRFPSKMPPPKVTGRQEIIIKSVQ